MSAQNLIYSPQNIAPGMLASPQILQCLDAGLLLEGWEKDCILPATYEMRLGAFACWYENGLRMVWPLGAVDDLNRDIHKILTFRPNSLTFITTMEQFALPCDIIARFNLRTRWVRKGLLLGTAPIVDPQFKGRLLLPIHNFSSNPVQIAYADRLVAVEFTKTLPVDKNYVPNPDPIGNIDKYLELTGVVESSVSTALNKHEALFNSIQSKTKIFSIAGAITLFLLICSTMTLMLNIFNLAENTRKSAAQAQTIVDGFSDKNKAEFDKMRDEIRELRFTVQKMQQASQANAEKFTNSPPNP